MEFTANVLYDFEAESESELTIRAGEVVTVLNTEVGEGWWYGSNASGNTGVFPETYVAKEDDLKPPEEPQGSSTTSRTSWGDDFLSSDDDDDWGLPPANSQQHANTSQTPIAQGSAPIGGAVAANAAVASAGQHASLAERRSGPAANQRQPANQLSSGSLTKSTRSRNLLFIGSNSGVDGFLSGSMEIAATSGKEAIVVHDGSDGILVWVNQRPLYTCSIGIPKKGVKFGGLKAYMSYPLTPSFSNIQVLRRYKHFDWLHERLTAKFNTVIAIPPLPDKQVTGRFEEELIGNRIVELQSFCNRISRHPILAECDVWKHFITETDEKRWTAGKRKAEADPLVGTALLTTIQSPDSGSPHVHEDIVDFGGKINKMEAAAKVMFGLAQDMTSKYRNNYRKDLLGISDAFNHLEVCQEQQNPCLHQIKECFERFATQADEQPARDFEPIQHMMHDYKGLTASWGTILANYHTISDRQRDLENNGPEKERIASRTRIHNYRMGVKAEMNYFNQVVQIDMDNMCKSFIMEQMNYHKRMADQLEQLYASCWGSQGAPDANARMMRPEVNMPTMTSANLDPWQSESIYEEVP